DAQRRLLDMNPAGLRMIEADSFDQVRGQCIYPIVVERDRSAFITLTNQVFQGQAGKLEFEIEGLKGGRRWLTTSVAPLYDHRNKSKINALLAITRDISAQKHAEQDLLRSQQRLVRAEILAHIGNWERDLSTNALIWSDEMYRLVGLEPGDTKGTYPNFLAMIHPVDRELVKKLTDNTIHEGEPYAVEYRLHRKKDGADLIIHATADIVRDQQGKPLKLVGTAQDITGLKQAEELLREAKEAAEKANRTKDIFLATLSHELRTPLTAILSRNYLKAGELIHRKQKRVFRRLKIVPFRRISSSVIFWIFPGLPQEKSPSKPRMWS
ncbi:PAS domain-containing protein, partial [Bdellovibrionota bacterium FG-1]